MSEINYPREALAVIDLVVFEAKNRRSWWSELNGVEIYRGPSPHFGAARAMIAAGHDPQEPVTTRTSKGTVAFRSTLGRLAHWSVKEADDGRQVPTLTPYRPWPSGDVTARKET